jgi:hypothetical protein
MASRFVPYHEKMAGTTGYWGVAQLWLVGLRNNHFNKN